MNSCIDWDIRFVAAFATDCPNYVLRPQSEDDIDFLTALFIACSPLSASLPPAMVEHQAHLQQIGHTATHPNASRWIVLSGETPIGRIVIDWEGEGASHCVDIALLPAEQGKGTGTQLLKAWITVSALLKRDACLQVFANNPAFALYRRLGFVGSETLDHPMINMVRPA